MVYDWFILFDEEFELIGKSRRSIGKLLYYFVCICLAQQFFN